MNGFEAIAEMLLKLLHTNSSNNLHVSGFLSAIQGTQNALNPSTNKVGAVLEKLES